jgi:hypothetical protein
MVFAPSTCRDILKTKLLLISLVSVATIAHATILKEFNLSELRTKSDAIVQAQVEKIEYQSVEGKPWTILHLRIEKSFRGTSSHSMTLRLPGGQESVNGRTLVTRVEGVPEVRLQERGIYFIETAPPSYPELLGWFQGYYRIIQHNQEEYALRSDGTQKPIKLQEFLREIEKNQFGGK